jgi:cellulose biosynthesis protein BcsQ
MSVLAAYNVKGGVQDAVAVNLAWYAAQEARVLVVDLDQGRQVSAWGRSVLNGGGETHSKNHISPSIVATIMRTCVVQPIFPP